MRLFFRFLALALLPAGPALAEATVHYGAPPAWVEVDPASEHPPTPASDVSYGYDYLLLDTQVSMREQATYVHSVYRVTAEGALQSAARLTLGFDPAYEELTLHHLRVIRAGRTEDRLKTTPVKTIQQERDLDRHMLNGELTALVVLEDIRVGDVIDYAYTRRGWNPAFGGRYFSRISTGWSVPMRRQRFRLIGVAGRVPAVQPHGPRACVPVPGQAGQDATLVWTAGDVAPIAEEKETSDWHESYPSMQFSEFTSWAQVVRWAEPLYALPDPLPDSVRAQAATLTRGLASDDDRAVALLQFVQQEIRYLGMELGAGSYRPTPPAEVLARRFGDCKDKPLLFCALARAAGLTAQPALVHTEFLDHIEAWLPTPLAFDHVIAALPGPDGGVRWVDPTLTYQQGGLAWRGLPTYRRALVVRPGNDRLSPVEPPATARSNTKIEETIDTPGFDQPARFRVRSTFTGRSADSTRREFAQNTPAEIGKGYVNYYASVYPGLTMLAPPRFSEDAAHNVVTVEESYSVPNLWKKDTADGKLKAEFYPKPVLDYAVRPNTTVRTSPLAVAFPANLELTTSVHLPEDWTITRSDETMESDAFRGSVGISYAGRVAVMKYRWAARADHVEAARVAQHMQALTRFRDALGYTLSYKKPVRAAAPPPAPRGFRLNWMLVLVSLVTLTFALVTIRFVLARAGPPPPPILGTPAQTALVGIGGWLYLVAIGVTVTPFFLMFSVIAPHRHSFNQDVWEAMTTPGAESYQAGLGALIIGEVVGNLILLTGGGWQMILFYKRHRLFPAVYITMIVFSLVLVFGDTVVAGFVVKQSPGEVGSAYAEVVRSIAQAAVWIPYMLVSRRVQLTFTK